MTACVYYLNGMASTWSPAGALTIYTENLEILVGK